MVIGPIRECSGQDPSVRGDACNGAGKQGWNWNPWHDGPASFAAMSGLRNAPGPDVRFLEAMVRCVGTKWKIDPRRLYIGGISAGATMTNRTLLFDSAFWAGGMPISGEWYVTKDDGEPLSFEDARKAVADSSSAIFQGRVGPFPLSKRMEPMIVIDVWGGERDLWNCGRVLCADYRPSTQASSNYYASQPDVVLVCCSLDDGHMWPQVSTDTFNLWALQTLASFPKGSAPDRFHLTSPPQGYRCKLGRFTDHY